MPCSLIAAATKKNHSAHNTYLPQNQKSTAFNAYHAAIFLQNKMIPNLTARVGVRQLGSLLTLGVIKQIQRK
jgi:hypothetical protein